jgi:hypothetical protein
MSPDEFRRHGYEVIDWIADYYSRIESFPVLSQVKPGAVRESLPASAPAKGEPFPALLRDVEKLILPGDPLAIAELLCFFPWQRVRAGDLGRPAVLRAGSTRHALGDESGMHRTGNARA